MKKTLPAIILTLLVICTSRYAYTQAYTFTFYNAADGLPSSEIISLANDEKGFLWVGTVAGVSRYDGYSFTNYQYSEEGYFLGMVNVIKPSGHAALWIGTSSGLYCLIQNRLIKLSAETSLPQGVNDILEDGTNLWLATENGPVLINKNDIHPEGRKKILLEKKILPGWLNKNGPIDERRTLFIKKAPDGTIYLAQGYSIYRINKERIEPLYFLPDKTDQILSLFPISVSKVYFDCAKSEMKKIENGHPVPLHFKEHYKPGTQGAGDSIWFVSTSGIFCFHPANDIISVFINTIDTGFMWPSSMLKDGNIFWMGTHDGLVKLKPSVFNTYRDRVYANVQETYSFLQLKDNTLLVGTNRGRLWKKTGEGFVNYLPGKQTLVPFAEVKALYEDERGWLWAGTGYQGISLFKKGKVLNFTKDENNLHDNTIVSFFKTSRGRFFAIGDQGASEILVDAKENISFKKYYYFPNISRHAKFYSGIEAPGGAIWIAGEEGIKILKNDSIFSFQLLDQSVSVRSMKMAADGSVWIATEGRGVLHCGFDKQNNIYVIKEYTEKDGLNTMLFIDLLVDREDNIWAGSAKGLTFIGRNGKYKGRVLNFNEADGFIRPGYSSTRLYQQSDGLIWAGTTQGLTSFRAEELFLSKDHPRVYITGVYLAKANSRFKTADSIFSPGNNFNTSFSYGNNSFNFNYTAIDFSNQQSLVYFYKLDGVDSGWVNTGYRTITYQNLVPGEYSFRVKALNNKGLWSENEAIYNFAISPPWWQTWWFRIASIVLAAVVVFGFIKRREQLAVKQEAEKTEIEKLKAISYQYQLEIEQVINYFATSIHGQDSIDGMIWDVTKNCISKLGFEDCVIYMLDKERNVLVQKAAWGPKTTEENKIVDPIEIPLGKGIVGAVAVSGKTEIINDTSVDERYIVDDARRFSEITVPVLNGKGVIGIIDSENSQKDFYTERHVQILTTVASLLGDKIDKMKAEQQTREKEIEVLQLNKDLATWQIAALRAQMNPHFIFNAMNSIQQFTLKNDSDNANLYISKFSSLLRKVLYTSQQNFISLEEEVEQLGLYLEIEKLRMGNDFNFEITVDEEIEADALQIPGMLVQPFVENAIKHGLPLRQGEKRLTINFSMPDEYHLQAVVTDNGIGRHNANELKKQQTLLKHESKGIELVKHRLQLLQQDKQHDAELVIEDLPDDSGTTVILIIPIL